VRPVDFARSTRIIYCDGCKHCVDCVVRHFQLPACHSDTGGPRLYGLRLMTCGACLFTLLLLFACLDHGLAGRASAAETGFPGLEIFTDQDLDSIGRGAAGLRFSGQIAPGLAEALEKTLLDEGKPRYDRLMLELDSEGGELDATEKAVAVLQKVSGVANLSTRVMDGKVCASGCIALFMTGKVRKASTASVWVFHGA